MRIENLLITNLSFIANSNEVLLISVEPYKLFEDNKPTDKVGGYSYTVVCPANKYEKLTVKVPSKQPIMKTDDIKPETYVSFVGFKGRFYRNQAGVYALSCKADEVVLEEQI